MVTSTAAPSEISLPSRSNWIARHPVLAFFFLAIVLGWLAAVPALVFHLPFKPFQTIGAYSPFLAAIIVAAAQGKDRLFELARRATTWRVGLAWYLLAVFGYALLYLPVTFFSGAPLASALAEKWPLIFTLYLPALFTTYLVNPIGEELGWTGFVLPYLQKKFSPWLAALLLGLGWAIWHLPAYFVPSEMGAFNPISFMFVALQLTLTRLVWVWIANRTQGSVLIAVLLHASSNAINLALIPALLPPPSPEAMAISGLLLLGILLGIGVVLILFTRGKLAYRTEQ